MQASCPICHKESQEEGDRYRPFCSERCKMIDLGHWAEGAYYMPGDEGVEEKGRSEGMTDGSEVPKE